MDLDNAKARIMQADPTAAHDVLINLLVLAGKLDVAIAGMEHRVSVLESDNLELRRRLVALEKGSKAPR